MVGILMRSTTELQSDFSKLVGFEPTTSRLTGEVSDQDTSELYKSGVTDGESVFCQIEVTLTYTSTV